MSLLDGKPSVDRLLLPLYAYTKWCEGKVHDADVWLYSSLLSSDSTVVNMNRLRCIIDHTNSNSHNQGHVSLHDFARCNSFHARTVT